MPEPQPVKRRQNQPPAPAQPWYAWIEPWYLSYALLGTVSAGLLPIVMPLLVSRQGSAAEVGLVMAALNVSGLLAPLWGWLADRYRLHRWILIAGLGLATLGIALFAFVTNPLLWAALALMLNLGVIAAATIANLFVVERHPRAEWDERLGWLQTAYGGGQVLGLVLAALVSQTDLQLGFGLASLSCLLALAIAAKFAQTPPASLPAAVVLRHPVKHTDGMFSSPQQLFHHLNPTTLRKARAILATPFSLWMGAWLFAASGAGAVFALYPMVMQHVFGIAPSLSSSGFAVAAALGLLLYAPAGNQTHRQGALALVRQSLAARAAAFTLLWIVGDIAALHWTALVFFTFVVLSWSFISVSATAFTAQLAPSGEGEGLGLFNAASALANIIGAGIGGWIAVQFGYPAVILFATIGVALGLAGTFAIPPRGYRRPAAIGGSMDALALPPGSTAVHIVQRPEPVITAPDDVLVRIIRVGICGTDREIVSGGRAKAPDGATELVIGHEMFGRVEAVGANVRRVQAGDFAVFTVRRGCGQCLPCAMNRPDMCRTGAYRERGIWGLDGYQTELVLDKETYIVRVPAELEAVGVLAEPLSVAEKAIDEAQRIQQARLPDAAATPDWLFGRRCLVAGLGPIGLLAALALRLRGADVYGLDVVDANTVRPQWLQAIGGHYLDGRATEPAQIAAVAGAMELIFEATGVPAIEYNLLDALAPNGVYVLTGIPGGDRPLQIAGAELMRRLVLNNQAMVGSVNAARDHFQMAVDDLLQAQARWGHDLLARLITHRYPYTAFSDALGQHDDGEIKVVLEWEHAQ